MDPIEDDTPTDPKDWWEASDLDEDEIEEEESVSVRGEPILPIPMDEEWAPNFHPIGFICLTLRVVLILSVGCEYLDIYASFF